MRISVLLNLIRLMFTSRHVSSCCVVDSQTVWLYRPALRYLKMFILKPTKLLVLLALLDLNGAILLHPLHLQVLP